MTVPPFCMNSQYAKVKATPGLASLAVSSGHWLQQSRQQQQQQVQQQKQLTNSILVQPVTVRAATVVQPQKVRAQEASTSGFVGPDKLISSNITTAHMTPTNTDTPLRRSEVGVFRDGARNANVNLGTPFNDDEEERRQARRRTMLQSSNGRESMFEENETMKKCLEIYYGNKLSKENAWSLSLIDTLSTLLDRHHKSMNNFKVAGSSLEASSKVYGLRVDSVHTDVLRMSAGLNAQKFNERQAQNDDDDDVATGGEGNADPNASAAGLNENGEKIAEKPKSKPKRTRRIVSTITKNKDTLNSRLDTVPLQDPVFGKLNTIVGSINSSNRLMNNILLTTESELRLRTTFRFWDVQTIERGCDYTAPPEPTASAENVATNASEWASCERLMQIRRIDDLRLRPLHTGYVISDTPEELPEHSDEPGSLRNSMDAPFDDGPFNGGDDGGGGAGEYMSMAFDLNAECEPLPALNDQPAMLDVDYNDFEELTTEERSAINNCRGLRKAPVLLEDLRPVDASSKLEYSYRPLDKISQFWAGPSHWKFKRARPRSSTHATLQGVNNQRATTRRGQALSKKRSKQLQFEKEFDDIFVKLDKFKERKANFQKKWDQRKLKLPTDLQLDTEMFNKFKCAPSALVQPDVDDIESQMLDGGDGIHGNDGDIADDHFADHDGGVCGDVGGGGGGDADGLAIIGENASFGGEDFANVSSAGLGDGGDGGGGGAADLSQQGDGGEGANDTVLEIATSFDGAPSKVTKIIVPFAKRAKVIDMKNLKRCCTQLINKQMKAPTPPTEIPEHPIIREEHYVPGMASFKDVYEHLPDILSHNMSESLSPSIAFYSVLHLANDFNLRLIPQQDLEDFKIRQLTD
ncbi:condensin complex subunit 2 [Ceratitis capitata]|uniref:condensin complex subunit 2 n=1 Tax=Ceratitis capitata TaxID=7213 RepID=UPI000329D359|nr:condensin complex subunit 2 [Ceratitis capitata]